MTFRVLAFCLLLVSTLDASAKEPALPMPLSDQLPVELVLNQSAIGVSDSVRPGGLVGAGLLEFAVVKGAQAAMESHAEKHIAGIQAQLANYRFADRIENAIRAKFPSASLSPHPQFTIVPASSIPGPVFPFHDRWRGGVMVVVPSYGMVASLDGMKVSLMLFLVERERKSNGRIKQRIREIKTYDYLVSLNKITGAGVEENAGRWEAMGRDRLTTLLDAGIDEVTDMALYDFTAEGRAESEIGTLHDLTVVGGVTYSGRRLRHGDNWAWVRIAPSRYHISNLTGYHVLNTSASDAGPVSAASSASAQP